MSTTSRAVVEAVWAALRSGGNGVLGIVVATDGSTYAKAGALLSLGSATRVGWISGGCLEPALESEALRIENGSAARLIDYDTRDEMDLLFGSRIGCRGLLRVALIPLRCLPGADVLLAAWLDGDVALQVSADADGVQLRCGNDVRRWSLDWQADGDGTVAVNWSIRIAPAPRVLVLGAGPETSSLIALLRELGARIDLVERRPRWSGEAALADRCIVQTPTPAIAELAALPYSAVLVMNHEFELDRESLQAVAATPLPWIGLLGPPRRRDDLLALLSADEREALNGRLHAPVGLALGGRGPAAIALSIAAQLQMRWAEGDG